MWFYHAGLLLVIVYGIFNPWHPFLVLYPNQVQLDDKQQPEGVPHHDDTVEMVVRDEKEELQDTELEQKALAKEDQMDSKSTANGSFGIQWGRRTLQKLLTNLGFPSA